MSNYKKFGIPPGFQQTNKDLNFLSNATFLFVIFVTFFYLLLKLYRKTDCETENMKKNLNENCGFITPMWTPFNVKYFPVYQLFFFYTVVAAQLIMKPALLITFLAYEIGTHIILRIKHLNKMIKKCFDYKNYEISRKQLIKCIMYHIEIIE